MCPISRESAHGTATSGPMLVIVPEGSQHGRTCSPSWHPRLTRPAPWSAVQNCHGSPDDAPPIILDRILPAERALPMVTVLDGHPTCACLSRQRESGEK